MTFPTFLNCVAGFCLLALVILFVIREWETTGSETDDERN